MAIAFDAASNASSASSSTTLAWSHTVGSGANRLLVVCVHLFGGTDVTGITFGAQSFTKVRHDVDSNRSEVWYLVAPAEGTDTITITWSAAVTSKRGSAVSLTGVDQTSPLDAQAGFNTPGSGQTSFSASITTVADNAAIVDSLASGAIATCTMGTQTNRVERFNVGSGGSDPRGAQSTLIVKATAGAQTMDWTLNAARRGGLSVASFKPAAAAFEIDAQPGSFACTGQLANGAIAAQAAPGGYAIAGAAATFVLDVPAAAGAYSWTGVLAQNEIAMPAAPGAVAWTGVVADLVFSAGPGQFEINAETGAFALAGIAANAAIGANAAPGAYAHTGVAAGFAVELPATAGAVTWSGVAVGLPVGYVLVASPGALVWTGVQAELVVLTLSVPTEGFTLPGRATDFTLAARAVDFDLRARPTDLVNPKEK